MYDLNHLAKHLRFASLKKKDASDLIHRELHRFTDWCGQDKNLEDLSPALLSKYAEEIGGESTS